MSSERWKHINALFLVAINLAPESRAAYLEAVCGDDRGLRAEVIAMIDSRERSDAIWLETGTRDVAAADLSRPATAASGQPVVGARIARGGRSLQRALKSIVRRVRKSSIG